ncbi:MAG: RIP metalloprotease RseP [Alphaproteobacteria bacterium]|nr:RIP metalloprotease RseP [Alphaproteobacteria bacterium]
MEILGVLWDYVLPFLVVLTVLVFVHELGHYWVARRCGVRVEVFSIGFGPELFGWTDKADTRWKISAIPLGGYVKMFGEGETSSEGNELPQPLTAEERQVSFRYKSLGRRAAIVFAGPAANFIFAIIVLAGLFSTLGQPFTPAEIGTVVEGSAADKAGLKPGDMIVRIDDRDIERFEEVQQLIRMNPLKTVELVVVRDGAEVAMEVTPTLREVKDRIGNTVRIGLLGVTREGIAFQQHNPAKAIWQAMKETWDLSLGTLQAVGQIISGSRSSDELGGPIKIAQMSGEVWKLGAVSLISFMALLSINLGLINLFPIPMLDGGHLLFFAFEAIRGRPLGEKVQEYGFRIGVVLVFSLMLFVIINDLVNIPIWNT